jgi:hypothetical protein
MDSEKKHNNDLTGKLTEMQGHGPAFGPTRIARNSIHSHSDPGTFENRRELIDEIARTQGEGYFYAAREALRRKDLLACDAELKKIGFPP